MIALPVHTARPTLDAFLALSSAEIAQHAPRTVVYAAAGTRRSAVLEGVPLDDNYAERAYHQMFDCIDLLFDHGVEHLILPLLGPSHFREVTGNYREHLWRWVSYWLGGERTLMKLRDNGWGAGILFADALPPLAETHRRLAAASADDARHHIWFSVVPDEALPTTWLQKRLASVKHSEDLVTQLYGCAIPPATLYIDFGKLSIYPAILPPLLIGRLNCYWTQRPGYSLDQTQLRTILYDHLHTRSTWQSDKTERLKEIVPQRDLWLNGPTIGLGRRLGPFWYPD